ncbi:MAG: serine/threonine-protein phosphatase, partial [Desulfobacterales bacterium]|nr:serine/threonine-protein phosphatase [Desulfobacterales bacterium]
SYVLLRLNRRLQTESTAPMATARAFLRMRASQWRRRADRHGTEPPSRPRRGRQRALHGPLLHPLPTPADRTLQWVGAGHPLCPGLRSRRRPVPGAQGAGLPLGVDGRHRYEEYVDRDLQPGHIIAIGTDGIWEAADRQRHSYGVERFCEVIRRNAGRTAGEIIEAVDWPTSRPSPWAPGRRTTSPS